MNLISRFWYKDDVKRMREILSKIHDSDLKGKLDALVTYAEASQAIAGSPQTAARLASHLPAGAKRALINLRLAEVAKSDAFVARQFLDALIRDAREIPVLVRSDLLLGATRLMASMDFSYACRMLVDVVDSFNEFDSKVEKSEGWNETVESSGVSESFNILLGGGRIGGRHKGVNHATGRHRSRTRGARVGTSARRKASGRGAFSGSRRPAGSSLQERALE